MLDTLHKSMASVCSKSQIVVSVIEADQLESDYASSVSSGHSRFDEGCVHQQRGSIERSKLVRTSKVNRDNPTVTPRIYVNACQQARERMRLAYTFAACTYRDLKSFHSALSESHRFSHRIVDPLFTWKGKNTRVIAGKSLGITEIEDQEGGSALVIHAGSHNYAGFYRMTDEAARIHKLALDCLPIAPRQDPKALFAACHAALRAVFHADFCYTTSTGYASNLLAFSAILKPGWLCIMDAKSHNSMHVGAYVSCTDRIIKFRHNDMLHLEELLSDHNNHYERVLVAVEGLFSMDGTIPPLDALARLKQCYGFVLLVDEAHSLLSVGNTGKGCVELWNDIHPEAPVPDDLVDIRTAVLSKTLGAIGGMVCGKQEFGPLIEARCKQMRDEGLDPVLTATMVQCLYVLGQPSLLTRRLARMRQMSQWARSELKRFGIHVYGDTITPLLPIHTGRASTAAKLSYTLRKCGVLATPVSIPAVPFWQSRIRVCLSADHTDAQLNTLVRTIISCAQDIGIVPTTDLQPHVFATASSAEEANVEAVQKTQICQHIEHLIRQDVTACPTTTSLQLRNAGHEARQQFGIAAGGARWISGTFTVHVETEKLIGKALKLQAVLSYSDSYIGLLSTISALCRPLLRCKTHRIILPTECSKAVLDAIKAAPRSNSPTTLWYSSLHDLNALIASHFTEREQITIYLSTSQFKSPTTSTHIDQDWTDITTWVDDFARRVENVGVNNKKVTILIHDTSASLRSLHQRTMLTHIIGKLHRVTPNQLVYGDFMSNFGVPGSYLAASQELVEELRYSSRGYMFSTASLPFVMGIVKHGLEYPCVDG